MPERLSKERRKELINKFLCELSDSKATVEDVVEVGFNIMLQGWGAMDDRETQVDNVIESFEANFRMATAQTMLEGI